VEQVDAGAGPGAQNVDAAGPGIVDKQRIAVTLAAVEEIADCDGMMLSGR
jgi:hypothetical protein